MRHSSRPYQLCGMVLVLWPSVWPIGWVKWGVVEVPTAWGTNDSKAGNEVDVGSKQVQVFSVQEDVSWRRDLQFIGQFRIS